MKKKLTIIVVIAIIATVIALFYFLTMQKPTVKVVFIIDEPYVVADADNNYCFSVMEELMDKLGYDFVYEYATYKEVMEMVNNNSDAIFFPFVMPPELPNRIMVSDTVYVDKHKVFYNSNVYKDFNITGLHDLWNDYVVGSHIKYINEIPFRRYGLTVHYSVNNQESMQKLVNGENDIAVVIEEKNMGLRYLEATKGENKQYIKYMDIDLFPEPKYVAAARSNEKAVGILREIDELLKDSD